MKLYIILNIFAKGYHTNKISHRHMPNHERKFSITASLHLRVKLTWAEQSMFINMRERAYCMHSSLCRAELQTEIYLKLLLFPALHALVQNYAQYS